MARAALRDMRAVAHDDHQVSLRTEVNSAGVVLDAAGIETDVQVELTGLDPSLDAVLAWAVREGATNVLRHSEADRCSITARRVGRFVRLEIVNDGAQSEAGTGSGLAGLADRASALQGSAVGQRIGGDQFRLLVEVPEVVR